MGWPVSLSIFLLLCSHVIGQPLEADVEAGEEYDFNSQDVKMLLERLFLEGNSRAGRDVDIDLANAINDDPVIDPVEDPAMTYSGDADTDDKVEVLEANMPIVGEESDSKSETVEEQMPVFEENKIDPQEVTRFNNYMDAIYRRMNAALRAKLMDPMTLNLDHQDKKKEKNRVTRSADEEDDDTEGRSFSKKGKSNKKKKKKGKKGKKKTNSAKRERSDDNKKSKKAHKTAEEKRKANKKAAEKKPTPQKITARDMREAKTMGSLAGIASLRRSGDVMIQDVEDHKVITSTFTVGPLSLEVSNTYGKGRSKHVRTAKAVTEVMYGTMQLKVKADGSAHVRKVVFRNPESVEVAGSVTDNRQRSDTYLRNSVKKMRPLAAQKILKTARYVLKAPSAVRRN